ncbi:hypothetical protein D5S17_23355 [Pseudonocardiaceae bacterium YIM PH 21723]|nr:hypothetical protein D5S17_23355 [Pseudonocardiaceae bacterium YIM PH 21723]
MTTYEPDLRTNNRGLNKYLQDNPLDADSLLGFVALLSVGKVEDISHSELRSWFQAMDLNQADYLPGEPRSVDAYESATGGAKVKYPLGTNPNGTKKQTHEKVGQTITLMMRHVVRDEDRIVRHLVRELADHNDEALSYEVKLAEAEFKRQIGPNIPIGSGDMGLTRELDEIDRLDAYEQTMITSLITKIEADFERGRQYISATRISKMLRDYIEHGAGGIRLQNGAYFVPFQHGALLGSLRELAARCGAQINRIPLLNTADQREMVGDAFNAKVGQDLDALARDIAKEQTAGAAAYRVRKLHARFSQVQQEAKQYQENLGAELGDTEARIKMINSQMATLLMSTNSNVDK